MDERGWEAWNVRVEEFPGQGSLEEQLRFALRFAILAPSSHNTQPWLFRVRRDQVDLYADRTRALPVADPDDRELVLSCGAALLHLRLALRVFGLRTEVTAFPEPDDPDVLARVRAGIAVRVSDDDRALLAAATRRRTSRRAFEARSVPGEAIAALSAAAAAEGAWLTPVQDGPMRDAVADLVAEGDRLQGSNPRFRREMAAWAHPHRARTRDGLPGYTYGVGDMPHFVGPSALRTFEVEDGHAAAGRDVAHGSPALAVLGTTGDGPTSWLAAGQALGRVGLRACTLGLSMSYLNQPVEVPELRVRLRETLKLTGIAQLVLRFGYGPDVAPTPRRALEDVLL